MRLAILLLLLIAAPLAPAEPLVQVNDTAITEADLSHYLGRFASQRGIELEALRRAPQFPQVRAAVLDQLIQRELLWQEARKGHEIAGDALQQAITRTERELGGAARLNEALRHQGMDREQLRQQLRQELSIERYLQERVYADINVSEEDVEQFYRDNRDRFRSPDLLHLRTMRLAGADADTRAEAKRLRRRLREGEPVDNRSAESADLGFLNAEDLGAELGAVAADLDEGEISAPVVAPQAVYLLQLVERRPGIQAPLDAVRERIAEQLRREQRERALAAHVERLAQSARIERLEPQP